jgi:hypothetical protein
MNPQDQDQRAAAIADAERQRQKRAEGIKKAGQRQAALTVLVDRFIARAVNDTERKDRIPSPEQARAAVQRFVPELLAEAAKIRAEDKNMTQHDALQAAAGVLEKRPDDKGEGRKAKGEKPEVAKDGARPEVRPPLTPAAQS